MFMNIMCIIRLEKRNIPNFNRKQHNVVHSAWIQSFPVPYFHEGKNEMKSSSKP